MKNSLYLLLMFIAAGCSVKTQKQKALPPDTEITIQNAKQVTAFDNTPESVVMYFYASMIRKDKEWEKVCPKEGKQTKMFRGKMEDYSSWTFAKYRFVKKEEFEKDKYWVTIYMSIIYEGKPDDGEDQVTVEKINGKWLITEVPT